MTKWLTISAALLVHSYAMALTATPMGQASDRRLLGGSEKYAYSFTRGSDNYLQTNVFSLADGKQILSDKTKYYLFADMIFLDSKNLGIAIFNSNYGTTEGVRIYDLGAGKEEELPGMTDTDLVDVDRRAGILYARHPKRATLAAFDLRTLKETDYSYNPESEIIAFARTALLKITMVNHNSSFETYEVRRLEDGFLIGGFNRPVSTYADTRSPIIGGHQPLELINYRFLRIGKASHAPVYDHEEIYDLTTASGSNLAGKTDLTPIPGQSQTIHFRGWSNPNEGSGIYTLDMASAKIKRTGEISDFTLSLQAVEHDAKTLVFFDGTGQVYTQSPNSTEPSGKAQIDCTGMGELSVHGEALMCATPDKSGQYKWWRISYH